MNWAERVARDILEATDEIDPSHVGMRSRLATIILRHVEPMVEVLRDAYRPHVHCLDPHYCCEACPCWEQPPEACTCGATTWNARVEAALAAIDSQA